MTSLKIHAVETRAQKKQFFQLPWQLSSDDPYWIPPLRRNQQELLGFKPHPFYDTNEIRHFLAVRGGEPVGRISAIVNRDHNRCYNEKRGFFGFFESVDDTDVSRPLFDAASAWLTEQGMESVRGPMNPSMNYECGLLIDGFDSSPTFMMTYNPPYYGKLVEDSGFEKSQDMYAFWGHIDMLYQLDEKLSFIVRESTRRFDLKLRKLDTSRFDEELRTYLEIYNASMAGSWGFVPLSASEIRHLGASLKWLIVPELTTIVEVDGKPVGSAFGLLDYNPRIREIDGRLFPFGFMKLFRKKHAIKRIRIMTANVIPEYQRWGLGLVVLHHLIPYAEKWGIQEAEFSWVLESNQLSYKTLKRGGAHISKTYRLYDRSL